MNLKIIKNVSRYVIPFYYDVDKEGYRSIQRCLLSSNTESGELKMPFNLPKDAVWLEKGFWENYKSVVETESEMELYSYLMDIFKKGPKGKEDANLGTSFVYKTNGKILDLIYRSKQGNISFECKNFGIILMKNGIGFIWYEITFGKSIGTDIYIQFQNAFKVLAHTHNEDIGRKTGYDKEKREDIIEPFCMGKWIAEFVKCLNLEISFWAERKVGPKDNQISIPDKALLFQYLFTESAYDKVRNELSFRIANGYDLKYLMPDEQRMNNYMPFGNTVFYMSKAGMACVVTDDETNTVFFRDQFNNKFIKDYFFIYILLLYQSYSCAHYSRLLTKLPADEQILELYINRLEGLNRRIDLFLVKSIFDSVSNVDHQNGLYRYGKDVLCIEKDIQSITAGLDGLRAMVRDNKEYIEERREKKKDDEMEKKDRKIDRALVIFGLMVVISALLDGLTLADRIIDTTDTMSITHYLIVCFILFLTAYLIVVFLLNRKQK